MGFNVTEKTDYAKHPFSCQACFLSWSLGKAQGMVPTALLPTVTQEPPHGCVTRETSAWADIFTHSPLGQDPLGLWGYIILVPTHQQPQRFTATEQGTQSLKGQLPRLQVFWETKQRQEQRDSMNQSPDGFLFDADMERNILQLPTGTFIGGVISFSEMW